MSQDEQSKSKVGQGEFGESPGGAARTTRAVDEMLRTPLEQMDRDDRVRLAVALLDESPARHLVDGGAAVLALSMDGLAPNRSYDVFARACESFHASRLVLLDVDHPLEEEVVSVVSGWWGVRKRWRSRSTKIARLPAAAWDVEALFCGSRNCLPAPVGGGAFSAGQPSVDLNMKVQAGVDVVVRVRHRSGGPAPFRAALLGRVGR